MAEAKRQWRIQETIPSDADRGRGILEQVLESLHRMEWREHDVFGVQLAMEEALVNAIKHGNRCDCTKRVRITCEVSLDRVAIEIHDEGSGFNPDLVPDPTDEDHLELANGRGIMLMRNFMTRVEYNEIGNCVRMEKHRPAINGH